VSWFAFLALYGMPIILLGVGVLVYFLTAPKRTLHPGE
jgi:hypothetical protein